MIVIYIDKMISLFPMPRRSSPISYPYNFTFSFFLSPSKENQIKLAKKVIKRNKTKILQKYSVLFTLVCY